MSNLLEHYARFIIEQLQHLGYWGIGIGMGLESACIPIPSELVLPFGGYMVSQGKMSLYAATFVVTFGSMVGSYIAYFLGLFAGRPFIQNYGKYFFISPSHFNAADRWFEKYGSSAVFFGRLLPIIRTFISLPAGIAKMNLIKFSIYSLIGMLPWNFALIYVGMKLGQNWNSLSPYFHEFNIVFVSIGAIFAIIYVLYKWKQKKENKKELN